MKKCRTGYRYMVLLLVLLGTVSAADGQGTTGDIFRFGKNHELLINNSPLKF